jgi:hypothetical protein
MMINAAVLGTTAISLSSAWAYGEVRGWPHSLQLPVRQAPGFLRGLPGVRGRRRRAGADSARAAATDHSGRAGAGGGDVAFGHHLPATVAQR